MADDRFVESPVDDAPSAFAGEAFDVVCTGIGEIITAVLDAGLVLDAFVEHREVPWKHFGLFEASADHPGEYALPEGLRELAPMTYTLVAHRP